MGLLVFEAAGQQGVAGLQGLGGARRACAQLYPQVVEAEHEGLPLYVAEAYVGVVGQPLCGVAVEVGLRVGGEHPLYEPVPEGGEPRGLRLHLCLSEPCSLAHPHDAGDVLRSGAYAVLLAPAYHVGLDPHSLLHVEGADALGAVDVVAAQGH